MYRISSTNINTRVNIVKKKFKLYVPYKYTSTQNPPFLLTCLFNQIINKVEYQKILSFVYANIQQAEVNLINISQSQKQKSLILSFTPSFYFVAHRFNLNIYFIHLINSLALVFFCCFRQCSAFYIHVAILLLPMTATTHQSSFTHIQWAIQLAQTFLLAAARHFKLWVLCHIHIHIHMLEN